MPDKRKIVPAQLVAQALQQVYCFYGKIINHPEHFSPVPLVVLRFEVIN